MFEQGGSVVEQGGSVVEQGGSVVEWLEALTCNPEALGSSLPL